MKMQITTALRLLPYSSQLVRIEETTETNIQDSEKGKTLLLIVVRVANRETSMVINVQDSQKATPGCTTRSSCILLCQGIECVPP